MVLPEDDHARQRRSLKKEEFIRLFNQAVAVLLALVTTTISFAHRDVVAVLTGVETYQTTLNRLRTIN